MIEVSPNVKIDENELHFDYIRATGPGGQNVNKVATSVQLRFDVHNSPSLEKDVKEQLTRLAGNRMTEEGVLVIEAKRFRTQEQNREDALRRLTVLIQQAQEKPKVRKATRPSVTAKAARLGAKKKHAEIKRTRRYLPEMWDE